MKFLSWAVIGGGVFLGIKYAKKLGKGVQGVSDYVEDKIIENKVKNQVPGTSSQSYSDAQKIADGLARAFGKYKKDSPYSTWDEDEEKVKTLINSLQSSEQGNLVKKIYLELTGFDLYANYDNHVHWPDTIGVDKTKLSWIQ